MKIIETGKKICCPNPVCRHEIGCLVSVGDREWLQINGMLTNVMRGVCGKCGAEFHWSISERMLSELVHHVLELRKPF